VCGIEVYFAPGPVSLARGSGAPALPAFVVGDPEGRYPDGIRLVIHPPLELQVTADPRADHLVNLRRFAAVYEQQLRSHPHNWHWTRTRAGTLFGVPYWKQEGTLEGFRRFVIASVPERAVVLVVSRGYEPLLELNGIAARHFPPSIGFDPRDAQDAIRQVETERERGATHLALPAPELWWLDHYAGLREHLAAREVARGSAGVVYSLSADA
jgi:hypothetical protein